MDYPSNAYPKWFRRALVKIFGPRLTCELIGHVWTPNNLDPWEGPIRCARCNAE